MREAIILHIRNGEEELGRLFLVHGHQGTFDSEQIAPLSRFTVRYIWRPIQRTFKIRLNTPARDFELRHDHDHAMYSWSSGQDKVILIAGHTHRPVFKSKSHEETTRKALMEAEKKSLKHPDDEN